MLILPFFMNIIVVTIKQTCKFMLRHFQLSGNTKVILQNIMKTNTIVIQFPSFKTEEINIRKYKIIMSVRFNTWSSSVQLFFWFACQGYHDHLILGSSFSLTPLTFVPFFYFIVCYMACENKEKFCC